MANNENLRPPWQKGQSGNPAGMKKGTRHLSTLLQQTLVKGLTIEINRKPVLVNDAKIIEQLLKLAAKGSMRAIEQIFDRIDGRVSQPIEHSGEINTNELSGLSVEELKRLRNELTGGKRRRRRK